MAKLSSLKIKMGQMQHEKQRKEHKLQAAKVGFPQDAFSACRMIMVLTSPCSHLFLFSFLSFFKRNTSLECDLQAFLFVRKCILFFLLFYNFI